MTLDPPPQHCFGMMVCCPMTTQSKGYHFEVAIGGSKLDVVLADRINSLDWQARKATRKARATTEEVNDVRAKIRALIGS